MLFYLNVLLVAIVLLACVDSASDNAASTATKCFPVANKSFLPTRRFLRAYATVHKDSEERVNVGNFALQEGVSKLAESARLKKFLLKKKTGVEVLNSLKIGDDIAAALESSRLGTLTKYIAKFNKKNPDKTISLIETLTTRYGGSAVEKALASVERSTDSSPKVVDLVKQLRSEQLTFWLHNDNSVDDVFELLNSAYAGPEFFASPLFRILDHYIAKFNSEKQGQETLIKTLTRGFRGESNFVWLLAGAKQQTHDPRIVNMAQELEEGLIRQWRHEKVEPVAIMKVLKLDNGAENALRSENLEMFDKYITLLSKNSQHNEVTLLGILTSKYGEANVAKAIAPALRREKANTELIAARLQQQQLKGWLENGMSPDDVFKLLWLYNGKRLVIAQQWDMLDTLDEFIMLYNRYNRAKPSDQTSLVRVLANSYGESKLAKLLVTRLEAPLFMSKAAKLQKAQFREWMDEGLEPASILSKIFKVTEADASNTQKLVASHFKRFYDTKNAAQPTFTDPRRS
ncbi:hypothetical protein L917_21542 [Phytophthora nicotianae]|uniref:RxLR effector protein n=1 Tax=Phytophthora nicotianae TaxID=4792 RepID=W2JX65_PHYNI|nr:hypothetical protein L917_21542 [Phytophthora nicotianae]